MGLNKNYVIRVAHLSFGSLTAVANLDIALFISDILQYTFSIFICNHGLTITIFFIDFSG